MVLFSSSEIIKYIGVFRLEGNFFVAKRNISYFSFFTNEVRGHSITTWTRREDDRVSRKSTLGHVTKGRNHVNCPQLLYVRVEVFDVHSRRGGGQNWVEIGPRSC